MKRTKVNLGHTVLTTMDMGWLVPIASLEVLPGDSFRHSTSVLVRVGALVAPVMHQVNIRIHSFFVPNRIMWTSWEDFITYSQAGTGWPVHPYSATGAVAAGDLLNYLGVPPRPSTPVLNTNFFPVRAYNKIYNEYFRDEQIQTPIFEDAILLRRVNWEKDYFTTARPNPQVSSGGIMTGTAPTALTSPIPINTATAQISIEQWRQAMAIQQLREHRNKYGNRYVDYLRYLGVTPGDGRLDRPEYLGGGSQTIAFSEVLATADNGTNTVVGDLAGHGIAALRTRPYNRFFSEHGWVLTVMSVRPKAIYSSGIERKLGRSQPRDYWQKEDEMLGDQAIRNKELYSLDPAPDGVWGYTPRHEEYRFQEDYTSGFFDSSLDYWHFARQFSAPVVLNSAFLQCVPQDRPFADKVTHELQCMIVHQIAARRLVSARARN